MVWVSRAIKAVKALEPVVLVTVAAAEGSSPREAGAKMLVFENDFLGTIGGGGLEFKVLAEARALLASGQSFQFDDIPLGPDLGQCCGGFVHLVYERLDRSDLGWLKSWERALSGLEMGELTSTYAAVRTKHWSVLADVTRATQFDAEALRLTEHVRRMRQPVWVFGAGHVGSALVPVLSSLDFDVTVVDDREDWLAKIETPGVEKVFSLVPEGEVGRMPAGGFVLTMTPTHALDFDVCAAALARTDLPFVGMIGSKAKRVQALRHFERNDIPEAALTRFVSPIGLQGLRDKRPAAIAVSVGAQLLQRVQVLQNEEHFA